MSDLQFWVGFGKEYETLFLDCLGRRSEPMKAKKYWPTACKTSWIGGLEVCRPISTFLNAPIQTSAVPLPKSVPHFAKTQSSSRPGSGAVQLFCGPYSALFRDLLLITSHSMIVVA